MKDNKNFWGTFKRPKPKKEDISEINESSIENIEGTDSSEILEESSEIDESIINSNNESIEEESINTDYEGEGFIEPETLSDDFLDDDEPIVDTFVEDQPSDEEIISDKNTEIETEDNVENNLDEVEDIVEPEYEDTMEVEPESKKEYIEREDVLNDEDSLMDSLLSDADDILGEDTTLGTDLGETFDDLESDNEDIVTAEPIDDELDVDELEDSSETQIDEPFKEDYEPSQGVEEPTFVYSEDAEIDELGENFEGYYNDAEINSKRKGSSKKNTVLKIIVGVCALAVIGGAAFGVRYFMNNGNPLSKPETEETTETVEPEINIPTVEPSSETEVEPEQSAINVENEEKDPIEVETEEKQEVSSFIQTFTGYVVDINNTDIYVSDKMNDDQITSLKNDFNVYNSGEAETIVYIKEDVNQTEDSSVDIIGESDTADQAETDETNEKHYHASETCEFSGELDLKAINLSELSSDYTPCPACESDMEIGNTSNDVLDYDYSTVSDLASIIYKKFNVAYDSIPSWTTIGSQVTISYIQNEETFLNDVIEITNAKSSSSSSGTGNASEITQVDGSSSSDDDYRLSSTNIFGSEFESIVATINDRKNSSPSNTGNVLDDTSSLAPIGTKESVSSQIAIGACDYVWLQIVWKKNADTTSIPDVDDVTVELQTPTGSLVNDSNINAYGKKWINKKVVNYVMKNPKVGNWTVLFTKDIGAYLGDVTIQAAPMTGFLQIQKAAAKYTDGTLKCIWQASGISDDNCKVQIYARNGNNDILLYSGNTIDDDIRTVDMVDIDTAKIAGNIYDIVIKVTDIDVTASNPKKVSYQFITDEYIVENIEIPARK